MKNFFPTLVCVVCVFSIPVFSCPLNGEAALKTKTLDTKTNHRAPDFKVTASKIKEGLEIKAIAPALHHFNLQAPMSAARAGTSISLKPSQALEQIILFKVKDTSPANYEVLLYLCDNAKTYCEKHKVSASWNGEKSEIQAQSKGPDPASLNSTLHPSEKHTDKPLASASQTGFILNRPEEALAEARQKGKPLLIDFFGIWCPPCNELDEVVFSSPEFEKQSAGFVKLKLDSDSPESWSLKTRYKVAGYPTVVFTSPDGKEISRIVGFRNEQVFLGYMKNAVDFQSIDGKRGGLHSQDLNREHLCEALQKEVMKKLMSECFREIKAQSQGR